MSQKTPIKAKILDFKLSTHREICLELGQRLKLQRLTKKLKQQELALRAGVSVGTVKNVESKGQVSFENLVRILTVLDLLQELEGLFKIKIRSIEQMEKMEKLLSDNIPRRVR